MDTECILCQKNLQNPGDESTFNETFCLPATHVTAKKWTKILEGQKVTLNSSFVSICELHFDSKDMEVKNEEKVLKDGSNPIFFTLKEIEENDQIKRGFSLEELERRVGWPCEESEEVFVIEGFKINPKTLEVENSKAKVFHWSKLRKLLSRGVKFKRGINEFYKLQKKVEGQISDWKLDFQQDEFLVYKLTFQPVPKITKSIHVTKDFKGKFFIEENLIREEEDVSFDDIERFINEFEPIKEYPEKIESFEVTNVKEELIELNLKEEPSEPLPPAPAPTAPPAPLTRKGKPRCDQRGIRALRFCDLCNFTCWYVRDMTNHMKSKHMEAEISCCGKMWNQFRYRVHQRTVHAKDKCCELCGQRFGYNNYLRIHMNEVHGKKGEFICKHCDEDFAINSQLKNHLVDVHGENMSCILCDICGASFLALHALVTHKKFTHKDGEAGKISSSKKSKKKGEGMKVMRRPRFSRVSHAKTQIPLKAVNESKGPDRPFKCPLCSLSYASDVHLKRHTNRVHDVNARKHECSLCPKAFLTNYELNIHIRNTHNQDEKKNCPLCDTQYNTKNGMRKHLTWGHTDSHYRCECGQLTKQVNTLKHHLKKMHSIVPTTKILVSMKVPDEKGIKEMLEIYKGLYKD